MTTGHIDLESRFELKPKHSLPKLEDLLPQGGRREADSHQLDHTFYDTTERDLARLGLTLRRRVGGPNAGWHLKTPSGRGHGIRSKSRSASVPRTITDPLFGVVRGRDLLPVATVSTTRTATRLLNEAGELLLEIVDDAVSGATMGDTTTLSSWREVEVAAGPAGDEQLVKTITKRLVKSGARLTPESKANQLLAAPKHEAAPTTGTLGGLVSQYVAEQCDEIVYGDLALRLNEPVVHATRVAVRRLRSTMRIFGPVFDPAQEAELEQDLVWFAGLLGEVRDRDVLRERYARQVNALPAEFVLGPVAAHIETTLLAERSHHLQQVHKALHSERYLNFLDTLNTWRTTPPLTDRASSPVAKVSKYVRQAERKLNQRLHSAGGDVEALHRARKAGKRFRYATELSVPVMGKQATKTVKTAKKLQTLLGEHQDSVVSATFLRQLGAQAGVETSHNGFTYGILLAQEWHTAEDIRSGLQRRYG